MAYPLGLVVRRVRSLVPIQAERFALAWIVTVVCHVALAREQRLAAIVIPVDQNERVGLGPTVVDHVLGPFSASPLFEPENAVIVRFGGDNVVASVAIDVHDVHEAEPVEI